MYVTEIVCDAEKKTGCKYLDDIRKLSLELKHDSLNSILTLNRVTLLFVSIEIKIQSDNNEDLVFISLI